ncbi:DUF3616 domain-containing protein [Bosea sp. PAMC 26642]|uniref:DUF3616 domain-containing protein n=1 Tax=Bosea sp. (strain PAMC 26642) TaxID=1792307 RepID=UPI0009E7A869|nr:DUF3616 domain-containing protein [Bosea sp. PAMC 26642]
MRPALALLVIAAWLCAAPARTQTLVPEGRLSANGDFAGKKGKAATDVSGLACMPGPSGARRCLLINDEGSFAQFAQIAENRITPGATLPILGEAASPAALGRPPGALCGAPGAFAELDGEAVAYADGAFYVAGSHGCSRRKGEFRLSSFHLARVRVDGAGAPATGVELSYRLGDMLRRAGPAAPYFGKRLMEENGLNIEGIAVVGDRLWAGLRAPSLDGRAFLVGASLSALFAPGTEPATAAPVVVACPVGRGRGIRDLAALSDGRLLMLVGPAQEQDLPYELLLLDPARPDAATSLGTLRGVRDGKAETVTLLSEAPGRIEILIGYDGRRNGDFERYRLRTP